MMINYHVVYTIIAFMAAVKTNDKFDSSSLANWSTNDTTLQTSDQNIQNFNTFLPTEDEQYNKNDKVNVIATQNSCFNTQLNRPISFAASFRHFQNKSKSPTLVYSPGKNQDNDPILDRIEAALKHEQINNKLCATFAITNQQDLVEDETFPSNKIPFFQQISQMVIDNSDIIKDSQNVQTQSKLDSSYHSTYFDLRQDITYKVQYSQKSNRKNTNGLNQSINSNSLIAEKTIGMRSGQDSSSKTQRSTINIKPTIGDQTQQTQNTEGTISNEEVPHQARGKSMEGEGLLKIDGDKYHPITFKISQKIFSISNVPIEMDEIIKVKIFPVSLELAKHNILKITTKRLGEELLIGLRKNTKIASYPLPYYTFSKVIIKKLKQMKISSVTKWCAPEHRPSEFLIKKKQLFNGGNDHVISKSKQKSPTKSPKKMQKIQKVGEGTTGKVSNNYSTGTQKILQNFFSWQSQLTVGIARTLIHGRIYKKSKHLGKWQKRYIVMNELGVFSFHTHNDKRPSIKIQRQSIKYLWTWFSLLVEYKDTKSKQKKSKAKSVIECEEDEEQNMKTVEYDERTILKDKTIIDVLEKGNKYLVIKIKHGFNQQTQFGVPICNFDAQPLQKNWLYSFYRILPHPPATPSKK